MELRSGLRDGIIGARHDLARAGTWLSGAMRAAVVRESRAAWTCPVCDARAAALSPMGGPAHPADSGLSADTVDVVHRLTRDHTRLSRSWFDGVMSWMHDGTYVEIAAIVATIAILDTFATLTGVDVSIGSPVDGSPDRRRPAGLAGRATWVPTVDPARAEGLVADLYAEEGVATVVEALTLSPTTATTYWNLARPAYLKPTSGRPDHTTEGSLTLTQVEFIASRLSSLNECFY